MYLIDFKQFFIALSIALTWALPAFVSAQPGPFSAPTNLVAPPAAIKLPDFEFANLNGGTLKSSEMKGKVIVIRFWATW